VERVFVFSTKAALGLRYSHPSWRSEQPDRVDRYILGAEGYGFAIAAMPLRKFNHDVSLGKAWIRVRVRDEYQVSRLDLSAKARRVVGQKFDVLWVCLL
jgi:hypothetical protein